MDKERKLIIAGNWKMNKTAAEGAGLAGQIKLDLGDLTEVDVVRHQLVQEIIKAYERFEDNKEEKN